MKESVSFAILVVAWLTEDEEKSTRPWGKVRAGDIAIAPKIQEHITVASNSGNNNNGGVGLGVKPNRKKRITISDAMDYPGRPTHLKQADIEKKEKEEKLAKKVLWNDALVSRVIRSQSSTAETV